MDTTWSRYDVHQNVTDNKTHLVNFFRSWFLGSRFPSGFGDVAMAQTRRGALAGRPGQLHAVPRRVDGRGQSSVWAGLQLPRQEFPPHPADGAKRQQTHNRGSIDAAEASPETFHLFVTLHQKTLMYFVGTLCEVEVKLFTIFNIFHKKNLRGGIMHFPATK